MAGKPGGREWLAQALHDLRQAAGISETRAAAAISRSQSRISRIETGAFVPTGDEIRTLCTLYRAPAATRRELLDSAAALRAKTVTARAVISRKHGWKIQQQIRGLESGSAEVCVYQPALIVGLLQTRAYMRLVFTEGGDLAGEDVERSIAERAARQQVLGSDRAFILLMAEGALRWQAGSAAIMLEQLDHLAEVIRERPSVRVGIIPQSSPAEVFTTHGFSLYDRRTVILGVRTGTSFITKHDDVADYSKLFDELAALAVFGDDAVRVISQVADGYRTN